MIDERGPCSMRHALHGKLRRVRCSRSSCRRGSGLALPLVPGHEFEAKLVVVDHEVAVTVARYGGRDDVLHLLCHHAHISGAVMAFVTEAIELDSVVEPSKG